MRLLILAWKELLFILKESQVVLGMGLRDINYCISNKQQGYIKNYVVFIHTMDYYSVIKNNGILPFATTWMDLEVFMFSEISQIQMPCYHLHVESKR